MFKITEVANASQVTHRHRAFVGRMAIYRPLRGRGDVENIGGHRRGLHNLQRRPLEGRRVGSWLAR